MGPNLAQLLDDEQLADYLGVKARFARRLCEENRLSYALVGRRCRCDPADVADYSKASSAIATPTLSMRRVLPRWAATRSRSSPARSTGRSRVSGSTTSA